jgi:ATP-dependent exoDNAse (exonuclease V) beta subunit
MSLIVLNASAGSGKTYNLVLTYLKLILDSTKDQNAFSEVMAMTFTNKAAFEMKDRIISYLHSLSILNNLEKDKYEKTVSICRELATQLKIDIPTVIKRSEKALKSILHHFEDFNVVTIDKFNLRLIRSFSKELNISGDFKIVLNEEEVLDNVVENLLDSLDSQAQVQLTNLVLNYSREKLNEEQSWNFQKDLKLFSLILTNEKYFSQIDDLMKLDFSNDDYKVLKTKIIELENVIKSEAKELFVQFDSLDFDRLPGKSRSRSAIDKLNSDSIFDHAQEDGSFFTTSMLENLQKENPKGDVFPQDVVENAIFFNERFTASVEDYLVLKTALKHFHNLALLKFISTELARVKEKEHIIRISEFNTLISQLIQDEYAPFIYERLGTKYKHFLLDEFQDTSRLQWMNLVPLVYESLSNRFDNLIVGDAKQSIYRFKNGVAEQFVTLPKIYNPEQNPEITLKSNYFENEGVKRVLENNFRSNKNIVQFNNLFYNQIANHLTPEQKGFYNDVYQIPKGNEGGYVEIHSEKFESKEEINVIPNLLSWVDSIILDGYYPGDICILGNTKVECNAWAIALSQKYQVVSDDSLTVHSDDFVKLTVAYLNWYIVQESELEAKRFIELYYECFSEIPDCTFESLYNKVETEKGTIEFFNHSRFIAFYFKSSADFFPRFENLYSLVQNFYRSIGIDEINNPYIHHFVDLLYQFDLNIGSDIVGFLKEYENKSKSSSIQIPENRDAIKIMTGHKSKGLEFPVVILPNMNFSLESKRTKLLVEQDNQFFYVPISKNSKIKNIREASNTELSNIFLDKLNLCYVMTTRPVERLYIGNYFVEEKNFGGFFDESLRQIASELGFKVENNLFLFGEKNIKSNLEKNNQNNQFIPLHLNDRLWFPKITLINEMTNEEFELSEAQRFGNQLHLLLSNINSISEVEETIVKFSKENLIEKDFEKKLKLNLVSIFENHNYKKLLEESVTVFSEQKIISSNFEAKVPDKIIYKKDEIIVVDFKTGLPNKKHVEQVTEYVNVLLQMESKPIKGYLFYTSNLELLQVAAS